MQRLILIAEDEALVAWELGFNLEGRGFEVAGPFATSTEAVRWLDAGGSPEGAILDYVLQDGRVDPLARALQERSIPFVIYGGKPSEDWPADLEDAPRVPRPSSFSRIMRALFANTPA